MSLEEDFRRLLKDLKLLTHEENLSLENQTTNLTQSLLLKKDAILKRLSEIRDQNFDINEHPDLRQEMTTVLTQEKQNAALAKAVLQSLSHDLSKLQKAQGKIRGLSKTYANHSKDPSGGTNADYKA